MASSPLRQQWVTLLSAALETWCHELLWVRAVYPSDTFTATRFLGISCKANRHPGVVRYIEEAIQVASPSIVNGSVTDFSFLVLSHTFAVSERFTLTFSNLAPVDEGQEGMLEALERGMRNLILSVISLQGTPCKKLSDDASFKLTMRTTNSNDDAIRNCAELTRAVKNGAWYRPGTESQEQGETVRILYHDSLPTCSLDMNMFTTEAS